LKKRREDIIIDNVIKCTERAKQLVKQNKEAINEVIQFKIFFKLFLKFSWQTIYLGMMRFCMMSFISMIVFV